jgi:CHAT domain-containing protein
MSGETIPQWGAPWISAVIAQDTIPNPAELSLLDQGRRAYETGDYETAIGLWQQALTTTEQGTAATEQARALTYLSLAHQRLAQWNEAETAIQKAIAHFESATTTPDLLGYAQTLNTWGLLNYGMGRSQLALERWQQAEAVYQQAQDSEGVAGSQINQAQALEHLGLYRQACRVLFTTLQRHQSCDADTPIDLAQIALAQIDRTQARTIDETERALALRVAALQRLGSVLRRMGNLDDAEQALKMGMELVRIGEVRIAQASSLLPLQSELGITLADTVRSRYRVSRELYERTRRSETLDQARDYSLQALDQYHQAEIIAIEAQQPLMQVQAQLQRFSLLSGTEVWLRQNGRIESADSLLPQIQAQWEAIQQSPLSDLMPSRVTADAHLDLAQTLLQAQRYQQLEDSVNSAIAHASVALQQAMHLNDPRTESYARGILGLIDEQLGDWSTQADASQALWQSAQQWSEPALALAQAHQAWDLAYRWQWQLGRLYEKQQQDRQAIAHYEAAVETLQSLRQDLLSISSDIRFSFRDDVEPVYRALVELLLKAQPNATPSQASLQQAIQQIDALQVSELENFLRCNLTRSLAVSETDLDPTAAVVYPIILKRQLAVIVKLPQSDQLQFHAIAQPADAVNQTFAELRYELEKPYPSRMSRLLGQRVYDWLIRPVMPQLEATNVETLVFVLDGTLRNVPMAALYDGEQYLVEQFAIALLPGLQLIEPKPFTQVDLGILEFGLSELRPDFPPHRGFAPLENVERELAQIQPQTSGRQLLNQQFTRDSLQRLTATTSFPIIHLATHGQFSSEPDETFILAWDQRVDINTLSQILQSRSQSRNVIELLVLSACKTAEGDRRAALGLAGVAVQSGARSTLASLWYVDDQGTAELMSQFYSELDADTPITKAAALRRAQITLLQNPHYRSPLYWAPYVLVGNWL